MQGLGLRKNSRRTPEKLFEGPAEAKEPQKRHVQVADGRNRYEGWLVGVRRGWRRKRVVGKCLTRPHAPVGKTRVADEWVVFWLRCFGKNWRSPPGAPCGVGKKRRRKSRRRWMFSDDDSTDRKALGSGEVTGMKHGHKKVSRNWWHGETGKN